MQRMWRSVLILLALLSSVVILSAQDEAEIITVVGSGIVNPVLENIITASETELEFDISTTRTTAAFEQLCRVKRILPQLIVQYLFKKRLFVVKTK
ncbi:MAG: hypothetical protein Q9P01_10205 [Anaerolineae bacterium]|nr:hypothetical protein [Anaerolineae bacterium]